MQIAVCDDEKEIRSMLAEHVTRLYPAAELSLFPSGTALLQAENPPDILLLDIQMDGKNGMETARELRKNHPEMILIFVSAREDFVFDAFDVGAFHYLVKPFSQEKFEQVLKNAVGRYKDEKGSAADGSLMIKAGGEHITVRFKDIVYAEVYNRKIMIHTMDSDIEYYGKMKELEKLAGEDFYRPHRAYLVNFDYIWKYDAATIYLKRGKALMAKQNYRDFVKSYLSYNKRKGKANGRK